MRNSILKILQTLQKPKKTPGRITLEQATLPMERSNYPLPGHDAQSNAWGMPGGVLKLQFDRHIM